MKIVTISREFGSGGRELGKRLADVLGFDYYDQEIITAIAQAHGMDEKYVEHVLENHAWMRVPLTFRHSFSSSIILQPTHLNLLVEQSRVIESIAKAGKDCVVVGRNADVVLSKENPFRIFVCADMETKVQRCMERAEPGENLSRKTIEQNIHRIDKNRAQVHELIVGSKWGQGISYHMTLNSSGWDMKELAPAVADFIIRWFERKTSNSKYQLKT